MNVRLTIYEIKFGVIVGISGYALQYATKYFMEFKSISPIMSKFNYALGLVGLIGVLTAIAAFIVEVSKRIIKHDNLFNFFKAVWLTVLIKKVLLRVDEFDPKTGKQNAVSRSFNRYVRWSYGDFVQNKMYIKVKIPLAGQANKIWQENRDNFTELITSKYPNYSFLHEVDRGYYVLQGVKN